MTSPKSRPRPSRGLRNTPREGGTPGCESRRRWCSKEQDRLSSRSGRRDSNPRRLPWQEGTTPFPAVTERYKIPKSQPQALPGRSTRYARLVLRVVLRAVEHHLERRAPVTPTCVAPELGVWRIAAGQHVVGTQRKRVRGVKQAANPRGARGSRSQHPPKPPTRETWRPW